MSSTVGRMVVDTLTNQQGSSVANGDLVYIDTGHDKAFITGTTSAYTGMVGVCIEPNGIANGASGRIQIAGHCSLINVNASVTRGHYAKSYTVAKQATDAGASRVVGAFGQFLTGGTTPEIELFGFPDGSTGSAGSPATPALTFGTSNAAGSAVTLVATDATLAIFDATAPVTQAFNDAAATGSAAFAAHRDHRHGMPLAPTFHGCRARFAGTPQTIGSGGVVPLTLDTELYDTDAFHFTSEANLTGTVQKTASSAAIVGTTTLFTSELTVNQVISIPGTATEIGVVKQITDDTHLTLWQTMANNASGQTATRRSAFMAIPAGFGGKYRVSGGARWTTVTTAKDDYLAIGINGTLTSSGTLMAISTWQSLTSTDIFASIADEYSFADGDYVAVYFGNNESGTVTIAVNNPYSPHMSLSLAGL